MLPLPLETNDVGVAWRSVCRKLGIRVKAEPRGPITHRHLYRDAVGEPLYWFNRYANGKGQFRRCLAGGKTALGLGDVKRTLYNLPHVVAADVVLLTEGEKKADVLSDLNLHDSNGRPAAVTTSGGADSWRFRFVDLLKGKKVVTVPDMDGPGQKYCDEVTGTLTRAGIEFTVVYFDEFGNDVRDFLKLWRGTLSRLRS